jgi:hypothetical protein
MARIAGLHLVERWGSWRRNPFTSDSIAHISVWDKEFQHAVVIRTLLGMPKGSGSRLQ